MSKVDGGPAFPHQDSGDTGTRPGMSLRDYFAARAMQQMIHEYFERNGPCFGQDHPHRNIPHHAYRMADAMIAARETK